MDVANHLDVVERVRRELVARGVSIAGSCGAFEITKRVAWALRTEFAGLLEKQPPGNNCQGYAVDIIVYPDGTAKDILFDSGGENGPRWNDSPQVDPVRYRPAIDPGDASTQPTEPPVELPPVEQPPIEDADDVQILVDATARIVAGMTDVRDSLNELNREAAPRIATELALLRGVIVELSARVTALEQKGIAAHLRL